jgi:hypothetical protein
LVKTPEGVSDIQSSSVNLCGCVAYLLLEALYSLDEVAQGSVSGETSVVLSVVTAFTDVHRLSVIIRSVEASGVLFEDEFHSVFALVG